MRSTGVVASRVAEFMRIGRLGGAKMKLPISLLVLVALGQAATPEPASKSTPAKKSEPKSEVDHETSKRELFEGNYGEKSKEPAAKEEVTASPPKIIFQRELYEMISDESPNSYQEQIFGVRLPAMTKISDVLTEHGPSFEAAVAKHLYSPVSAYKLAQPSSFKSPAPAPSQSLISKLQESSKNLVELPSPHYTDQQGVRVDPLPIQLDSRLSQLQENVPQETFRPKPTLNKPIASIFPIYDQIGPFRFQGQVVPAQYFQESGVFQMLPRPGIEYSNQEGNRDNNNRNNGNPELFKAEPKEPKQQVDLPVPNQGYYAHPNGAFSFASFSHKLPFNAQSNTAPQIQAQPERVYQSQPTQQEQQIQTKATQPSHHQRFSQHQVKPMVYRVIQEVENYEPTYQHQPQQFIPFQQQPRTLNALQQHLLFQVPQQLVELQPLPAYKPLPNSIYKPDFSQHQNQSPKGSGQPPRPFSNAVQTNQHLPQINIPIGSASSQHQLIPLSIARPDNRKYIQSLLPHSRTTPAFLPTPLQVIPTSTPKDQLVSDQVVSSTTTQPDIKDDNKLKEQFIQKENLTQSQSSSLLAPELIHQSQPKILPQPIRSTTYLPFVPHEPQSIYFQYSTPPPVYQSLVHHRPRPIQMGPRTDVVIQRQEIKEYIFGPSPQPRTTTPYQHARIVNDRETFQLRSQDQQQLFEQLLPLQYQQELQDLNSEQYQLETRQSPFHQQQHHVLQHGLNLLQQQLIGPEQVQQHYQAAEQPQQQQQASVQSQQHQQVSDQSQQLEHHVQSENQTQTSTLSPAQELEKQTEAAEIKELLESRTEQQTTTEKPEEEPENLTQQTPSEEQQGPDSGILSPVQLYAQPQQLEAGPGSSLLAGIPSYSDVQYFGKFAESLFGNRHY